MLLERLGQVVPVLGPFYGPKFGAKKVSPHRMPSWMGMGRVIVPYDLAFGHKQVHGSNSIEFTWPSMQLFVSKQC